MMSTAAVIAIAAGIAVLAALALMVRSWVRLRGVRVVTCPESGRKAGVELDARHAAVAALTSTPNLRLSSCTRWPERQGCGQECLHEVATAGPNCLLRSILGAWYAGKQCASCGTLFGEIDWTTRKPALLTPDGKTIEWAEIPAEHIDAALATHKPVCFACHVTSTFVRQHPDMIVDRSVRTAKRGA